MLSLSGFKSPSSLLSSSAMQVAETLKSTAPVVSPTNGGLPLRPLSEQTKQPVKVTSSPYKLNFQI